jgi:hypothetical protein
MKRNSNTKKTGILSGKQPVKNVALIQKNTFKSNLVKTVNKRVNNPYKL